MNWIYFNEEHMMLRNMVREFAINEIKPLAQKIDNEGLFPEESINKMAELGLMGIPWDTKYGGNNILENKEVSNKQFPSMGCNIKWK